MVLVLIAGSGGAHSLTDELILSGTKATESNPRTGSLADRLTLEVSPSDAWTTHTVVGFTRNAPSQPAPGAAFATSAENVLFLALGADWLPNDRLDVGIEVSGSPRSQSVTNTVVEYAGKNGTTTHADAPLKLVNSTWGSSLSGSYSTPRDSASETLLEGSVAYTNYATTQGIAGVKSSEGADISSATLLDYCASHPGTRYCTKALPGILRPHSAQLGQIRLELGLTETILGDTDVGLSGAYYAYSQDPTQVGYFSVLGTGRTRTTVGNGLSIAPLLYSIHPSGVHRWGKFSLSAYYEYGQYVSGQGYSNGLGAKCQYRFSKRVKLYLALDGALNVDASRNLVPSESATFGGKISF